MQVLLPVACEMMLGRSYYWPIYEAAARHDLPIGIHAGSMYRYAPTSDGLAVALSARLRRQLARCSRISLLSLISNGVFNKFPDLKFVLIEFRRDLAARLHLARDQDLARRASRGAVGQRARPPRSIRDNIRLTMQPFDAPGSERRRAHHRADRRDQMLLFASDYPHWQFEGDAITPAGLSDALQQRMRVDNPLATYPRLKETVQ